MERFFHAARLEDKDSIMEHGLELSGADECDCGVGVHVASDEYTARYWCDKLSAEASYAGDGGFDCVVIAVDVSEDAVVEPDRYRGDFDAEG